MDELRKALVVAEEFIVATTRAWKEAEGVECGENEVLKQIRAALAIPRRNCDKYENDADANIAWRYSLTTLDYGDWLFAKGDGDDNKNDNETEV